MQSLSSRILSQTEERLYKDLTAKFTKKSRQQIQTRKICCRDIEEGARARPWEQSLLISDLALDSGLSLSFNNNLRDHSIDKAGLLPDSVITGMPICEAFAQIEQQPNIYDVVHVKYIDEEPLKLDIVISFPDHGFHLRFDPLSQLKEEGYEDLVGGTIEEEKKEMKTSKLNFVDEDTDQRLICNRGKKSLADFSDLGLNGFKNLIEGEMKVLLEMNSSQRLSLVLLYIVESSDCSYQRLCLIEVFDVKRLQMRYSTFLIGGPSTLATFVAVYALFGPTFPGIYDKDRGLYTLFYPGLSFAFPIPTQYTGCFHEREAELPLEFPDGTTPVACRVSIYDGSTDSKVGVGSLMSMASAPPLPAGSLYMEEVLIKIREELWFTVGGQRIPFGASPQDVWTELGRPCGIHQKQVDQMMIHSASDPRPRTTLCGDYFYNYFTHGLDILFDGQTHKIKKFVLHTNYPGHSDFNSYIKCNFVIYGSDSGELFLEGNTPKHCITPSTKWEQVKEILGDCGRAAIQTQGSTNNPFGSTFVYGYQNVAFEVMKNGYIATVTLFQS
ncbi:hypothetical protein HHK36_008591 [Tetracentron sinense]|uniref:Uncharacterized protein n=1 Tax=Tetracentron sinense TaxID=13715 RepID=A0A835DNB8_TETSI|nr:hypothetical protein HHK36_008591 [Tetracentron sinense]